MDPGLLVTAIWQQAGSLAARVTLTGYQQADALTAEAGDNPLLQAGAKAGADQLRKETDEKGHGDPRRGRPES